MESESSAQDGRPRRRCHATDRDHDVVVFESSDGVGGRVRTGCRGRYLLDRGFQILLTAYPVAQRMFDMNGSTSVGSMLVRSCRRRRACWSGTRSGARVTCSTR